MSTTSNIGLTLTPEADTTTTFKQWRTAINGEDTESNMNKIDVAIGTLDKTVTALDSRLSVLESNQTEYGIRWVTGASACEGERCIRKDGILLTGTATGLTFSVNSDGSFTSSYDDLPIWGEMERVTISNQVMVRVPRYYIKRETVGGYDYVWVCRSKKDGYRCAGIFLAADGTEKDYYYIGAYESTNDALGLSQSGAKYDSDEKPYNTGYTITEYREAAQALGDGWGITTIAEVCDFWQVIPFIEFGTKDAQSIAAGIVSIVDPPIDEYFPDQEYRTGMCDNVTGLNGIYSLCTTNPAGEQNNYDEQEGLNCGANPFVYRGIENPYGCIEKYVDGLVYYNSDWYASNDISVFATDTVDGYTKLDYTSPTYISGSNTYPYGWIKSMTGFDDAPYVQLPSEIDGGAATKTYYSDSFEYSTTANKYLYPSFGGYYGSGGSDGLWCLYVSYTSSNRGSYVGSRLSYTPV